MPVVQFQFHQLERKRMAALSLNRPNRWLDGWTGEWLLALLACLMPVSDVDVDDEDDEDDDDDDTYYG